MTQLTESQRDALRAFCDTIVPAFERPDDPAGFWGRKASDLGVGQGVEQILGALPPEQAAGMAGLLDAFASMQLAAVPDQETREAMLRAVAGASPEAAGGVGALTQMTLFLYYGAPDPSTGTNPNWSAIGYPGPPSPPPQVPKAIPTLVPEGEATLEADVCVVGSGAGGGVVAGTLAQRGLKVAVLEAGGYFNESDFSQLEVPAYQQMYWRGGPTPTADGNVSLQAGATFGGGTTINWMNCLRTKDWVREEWAREHGLGGLDTAEFDHHLDHVLERIGATDRASDLNGPHQRLKEGCDRLGLSFRTIVRNADVETYSPHTAGFLGFGDQSGSKLSTERTFLRDAAAAGAQFLVRCGARRILVERGRAAGVAAVYSGEDGTQSIPVVVRAPQVVVAGGALESPALLARSGIGGPAVGDYLRVHPSIAAFGAYAEDQRWWWGAPQAGLCDEFADLGGGYGFLVEVPHYTLAVGGSAIPWTSALEHRELMERYRYSATFIGLTRDRGHGRVVVDAAGEPQPFYAVEDELDVANLRRAWAEIARLHEAAGAEEIYGLAAGLPRWARGESLDDFIGRAQAVPLGAGGARLFSAHQMGTCRMGLDPQTSVASPSGELHDTPGVWIGDGSAFPTASGTNPMVTVMALAHRTAERMAAAVPAGVAGSV